MLQTTKSVIHNTLLQHYRYTIHSFSTAADIIVPKWSDSDDSDESNASDHDEQAVPRKNKIKDKATRYCEPLWCGHCTFEVTARPSKTFSFLKFKSCEIWRNAEWSPGPTKNIFETRPQQHDKDQQRILSCACFSEAEAVFRHVLCNNSNSSLPYWRSHPKAS